jgi:hypothetical protein
VAAEARLRERGADDLCMQLQIDVRVTNCPTRRTLSANGNTDRLGVGIGDTAFVHNMLSPVAFSRECINNETINCYENQNQRSWIIL